MQTRLLVVVVAVLVVSSYAAPIWGPDGHQVTGTVAQALLSPSASSKVSTLLAGQTLAQVSTWADEVKTRDPYRWSAELHFINTPDWACDYDYSRDCGDGTCVSGAIKNYTKRLSSSSLPMSQRAEALKFLVHFIGDIHQPMHVSFTSDRGGNNIKGTFLGNSDNLHYIWDTPFPQMRISDAGGGDQSQYSQYLIQALQNVYANNVTGWASCSGTALSCPDDWAEETIGYACSNAYVDQDGNRIQSGFNLGQPYYQANINIIDQQLVKGGVRLAATLNRILSTSSDEDVDGDDALDQERFDLISNHIQMQRRGAEAQAFFNEDREYVAAKLASV